MLHKRATTAAAATFSRFIPTVKANFDYGVTIFILTFSLVAMSGYRVDELLALAQRRVLTVIVGIFICLSVSVVICPVWAGAELHRQIVRNMEKLADSLECMCPPSRPTFICFSSVIAIYIYVSVNRMVNFHD